MKRSDAISDRFVVGAGMISYEENDTVNDSEQKNVQVSLELLHAADPDLDKLASIHRQPSVSRFLPIAENYFDYVTGTEGVKYYKIIADGVLAGGIHCEADGDVLYLAICIDENHRRRGIAEAALKQLLHIFRGHIKKIEVSIEETNKPSMSLFEKAGFVRTGQEDELITYCYLI